MAISSVFDSYTHGKGEMDSRTLQKLCIETKLFDKNFTKTDCDLVFTKMKAKGKQRITIDEFESVLEEIASRKKCDLKDVVSKVEKRGGEGPKYIGTEMDNVRFYDDKSTFTGVHAHGGPSTVDKPNTKFNSTFSNFAPNEATGGGSAITLDQMCDRSKPDVRGVNKTFTSK